MKIYDFVVVDENGAEYAIDDWNNRINRGRNDKKRKN
jgi:hypothetical protein